MQIARISSHLPRLLAELNRESVELVLLHLSTLFRQTESAVLALWQLFEPLARALGPKEAVDAFLKDLVRAFDPEVCWDFSHRFNTYIDLFRIIMNMHQYIY